jgi:salicylate hydroxylase
MNGYAIALEDGAFMGKIFSHTRNRDRVPEFLYAFEEHRRDRCFRIRDADKQYITTLTLPDGEMQESRDALMRANQAAGRNVMDGPESALQDIIDEMRLIFGYEPTDDADEWWMSWGRLRDASEA